MKVCLIIDDYMPDSIKIGAKMMHELACEFQKQGHEVTVITPSPSLKSETQISILDNVTICRFKSGEIKNIGKVKRAINETLLSYYAWKYFKSYFKQNKHDIIVYYSPSIFWGGLVKHLKELWQVSSYLVLRDLFPQWALDQGLIRQGSLIEKYFRYFEKKSYLAANTIGLMSKKNLEWFQENVKTNAQIEVLYNWANNTSVKSVGHYRRLLNIEDKVVYFYGGNIGHSQDMMNIVRLAINMRNEKQAVFVFVGAGDEFEMVKNAIQTDHLTNIILLPSVSQNEFKQLLAEFDIGLFTLHKNHKTHNFPGKLLGYMVQEMPMLGSINQGNDLKDIVGDAGAGFITINGDDNAFLVNALKLLHDDKLREKMGHNAKKLLEDTFSVKSATQQILKTLDITH